MLAGLDIEQHKKEIHQNLLFWQKKALLRKIYKEIYQQIKSFVLPKENGLIVELGSGIGKIKETIPECICTDIFPHSWIDQVENAYSLSFKDQTVGTIILSDVFHHLQYPGTALAEFQRILRPKGRVILFEPCMSVLGLLVYGLCHREPIAIFKSIQWLAPSNWNSKNDSYYAAQGNAYRIFYGDLQKEITRDWNIIVKQRSSALTYIASGGYSGSALYPQRLYFLVKVLEKVFDLFPIFFACRLMIVLEKR
jgi:SAM-dependent methyltransferase